MLKETRIISSLDDENLIKELNDAQIDYNDEQIDVAPKEFDLKEMNEMFRIAEIFKERILNGDPNLERPIKVRQETENSFRCYQVLYEEKRKKNPLDNSTPIFIQERIVVRMYSVYTNKN
jgi:hypothetical protein